MTSNCPTAAPTLPVPSTIPVTVANASLFALRTLCLPRSADMAELIRLAGPPIRKPVCRSQVNGSRWSNSQRKNYNTFESVCRPILPRGAGDQWRAPMKKSSPE